MKSTLTLLIALLLMPLAGSQATETAPSRFYNFITRQDDKLTDGNQEFRFIGANIARLVVLYDFALRSPGKTLVWVVHPPTKTPSPAVAPAAVKIPVAAHATYRLKFWDTEKGVVTGTRDVAAADNVILCGFSALAFDLAIKAIARQP